MNKGTEMLAKLGRSALQLTALSLLISASTATAQEPAKPAPDLTGVWMIDFKAMDEHPKGVEFLSNWSGQAVRYMAFKNVMEFTPDGRCSFDDDAAGRCQVVRLESGALRVCRPGDAAAPSDPDCMTFEHIDPHRMLITERWGEEGMILRRVSDFSVASSDARVTAKVESLQGNWIVDVAKFQKTEWYQSLPDDPKSVYKNGPLGIRRLELQDGEARCFYAHKAEDAEPLRFAVEPTGLTFDGELIVKFNAADSPQLNFTAVIREEGPDLIWLRLGLEASTPFHRDR